MNNQLPQLILGDVIVPVPVIQGGMGVGVSRSRLAGAVAKEGGIGVISTAQIGYDEENFEKNPAECNRRAIIKHIAQAKEIAGGNGLVGVNIMVALKHYRQHIETAVEAGADVIICGAGLPVDLPGIAQNYAREHGKKIPKLMPIVSSARAAGIILKMWDHHYHTVPDCIIVEGPMAGGHLGFQESVLENIENIDFDAILCGVIDSKKPYEEKYTKKIPVAAAGGIFDRQDIDHVLSLGADAVQIASRFVVTKECDASDAYKRAYIEAGKGNIQIVKSPVGMPGRAVRNAFIRQVEQHKQEITGCYQCLEKCNPKEVPYCITQALIHAVKGELDQGLIFCGENVSRIHEMTTVPELMRELTQG